MQFTSIAYMAFLAVSVVVFYLLPDVRSRTVWLLAASALFYYLLSPRWFVVLLVVIAIGYAGALLMGRSADVDDEARRRRRNVLVASIVSVVAILFVFKYTAFAAGLANRGIALAGSSMRFPVLELVLPVGVSFWTFTTISYLVDVFRGTVAPERDLGTYALFVGFFPHVTAGPIDRAGGLLPQLKEKHRFRYESMRSALLLIGWGVLKKVVVADPLGVIVESVYKAPRHYGAGKGLVLGIASVAFAIQLYCDFSGYTDIVRGSARLFGVELLRNFDNPYHALSMKDFWRRWHMSLMGWLRDYVYIPLGGSRVAEWRHRANVLVTFLVSGIWHGAGLHFVVWGLLNGGYQVVGDATLAWRERVWRTLRVDPAGALRRVVQWAVTMVLIVVGWVFFRAQTVSDAFYILPRMFLPTLGVLRDGTLGRLGLQRQGAAAVAVFVVVVFAVEYLGTRIALPEAVTARSLPVRWVVYIALILAIVVFGYYGPASTAADFAYFKF